MNTQNPNSFHQSDPHQQLTMFHSTSSSSVPPSHQQPSVIVHTQQQQQWMMMMEATANDDDEGIEEDDEEEGKKMKRGRRRKRKMMREEAEEEEAEQREVPSHNRKQPEAIGVRKFISPFAPEATIPLPHELEMSAHGTTVWKRNERERQRVRNLNDGYTQLRERLPLIERDRRMSKVDSLRLAIAYILHLDLLLQRGHAHWAECECFRQSYGSADGSSAENTPPPN